MTGENHPPLLFQRYPALQQHIPWTRLAPLNTPVQRCAGLQKALGLDSLWIKRDDLTSPLYGGNKVRKLEFILAAARKRACREVIAIGGIGSNHCVANAFFCRELGLAPAAALVDQPVTRHVRDNLLMHLHLGTRILYAHGTAGIVPRILWRALRQRPAYVMAPGGSSPLGMLGFVNAAFELREQVDRGEMPEPDHLFVACGSCGTAAGLALGVKLAGLKTRIHAVQVAFAIFSGPRALTKKAVALRRLLAKTAPDLPQVGFEHLLHEAGYSGGVYGRPTPEGLEAISLVKDTEGITLEPVYTGKTFAALRGFVRDRTRELHGKTLLYWHTYNSAAFPEILEGLDYRRLPRGLHRVFEEPLPDFGLDGVHPAAGAGSFRA